MHFKPTVMYQNATKYSKKLSFNYLVFKIHFSFVFIRDTEIASLHSTFLYHRPHIFGTYRINIDIIPQWGLYWVCQKSIKKSLHIKSVHCFMIHIEFQK